MMMRTFEDEGALISRRLDGRHAVLADDEFVTPTMTDTEVTVGVRMPDPAREAVVDVVSLRGLARAVSVLRGTAEPVSLDSALSRMINVNGAFAKALAGERR